VAIIGVLRPKQVPAVDPAEEVIDDGLDSFGTESPKADGLKFPPPGKVEPAPSKVEPAPAQVENAAAPTRNLWLFLGVALLVVGALTVALAMNRGWINSILPLTPDPATLTLDTSPIGALVSINGEPRGATPLSLSLAAGTYQVKLIGPAGQERALSVTLTAGQSVGRQIEWAAAPSAATATTGSLQIQTDPSGQAVLVDDVRRGTSPLTITDLAAGEHKLVVVNDAGSYRRTITITAGETMSVVVAPHAPAVSAGWLRVTSPVQLQLRSQGALIGTTESERVMLPAGDHEIDMINDALGFSRKQRVTVSAGRTAELRVNVPNGLVSINAVPWAEVWLNGERLGETPIANLSRPIGNYKVIFRHPQFGERQASLTISAKETARLGVDMRQPQ
jgi:hypothetical protein